jgi:hypothetical protein
VYIQYPSIKTINSLPILLFIVIDVSFFQAASAQPTLELANGSGPTISGSTIANQVITFQENVNNPSDNVFTPYTTPTMTATFSLSNQQYTLPTSQSPNQASVSFGGYINASQQNNAYVSGGSIDLSRYPAGVYFLGIRNSSGQVAVLKILKN